MLRIMCIACKYGHHERHVEVIQAVPEGMLGGMRCPCKGECMERPARHSFRPARDARAARGRTELPSGGGA